MTALTYQASHIKRIRATKAEVEAGARPCWTSSTTADR